MANKKEHSAWEFKDNYHKGDDYGCVWRHDSSKWHDTPCDHKYNAFNASKGRSDMYNRNHRLVARVLGYLDSGNNLTGKGQAEIIAAAREKGKDEKWAKKFFNKRYKSSLYWLSIDADAWTINHAIPNVQIKYASNSKTFVPRPQGGPGAWFPYYHNAHHIIPQGAFRDHVIYGEGEVEPGKRLKMVLASKWNINNDHNMVILPQELQISRICGLPAHCPYYIPSHREYSLSLDSELADVKKQIDKAVATENCEDIEDVVIELDAVEEAMLEKIKVMEVGKQIGT